MSKKRKRVYDGKLPLVSEDKDGHCSIQIADGCTIVWWSIKEGDCERWFVKVRAPSNVDIHEISVADALLLHPRH